MKIEKISDNQIRCTLNRSDLLSREIKISELAYGTEKAKTLFHDMIEQASHQFGFEAEEVPLMIEAIPVSPDCIVLIITKVDDPEELDTRFSRFAPAEDDIDADFAEEIDDLFEPFAPTEPLGNTASEVSSGTDAFVPMSETLSGGSIDTKSIEQELSEITRLYSFKSWDLASGAACEIGNSYRGNSSLHKHADTGIYYMALTTNVDKDSEFYHACNICSEYGTLEQISSGIHGFLAEHCETIISNNAIDILIKY